MAAASSLPFVIPKCIKRSKTAVLKALSATVGVDKTAPHFSFIDDPTTIPTTVKEKRNYFLAKEFGRRAARQLAEEWPTLFMFDRDKPRLEAFRPEKLPMLSEMEDPTEDALRQLIDAKRVAGALKVFERLRAKEAEVLQDTIQDLFMLTAYFNAQDPPPSENEEWPGLRAFYEDPKPNINETAELISLLYTMVEKNAANQSTMICWLCKYADELSKKRALELFNEAKAKKWILEEDAFINMIHQATTVDEINEFLKHVAELKLKPTIRTFNAALTSVNKLGDFDKKWEAIKVYLAEATRLGLEPNLTTYYNVLLPLQPVFSEKEEERVTDRMPLAVNCLAEALEKLESQSIIECQQFTDQQFFNSAMIIAAKSRNMKLVDRVEKLYSSDKNKVKLSAFTMESSFYSRYLQRKLRALKDIEQIGELYKSLVPRIVGVNRDLLVRMVYKLQGTKNWRLIKRVIEDGLNARHILDKEILQQFSMLLSEVEPNDETWTVTESHEYETLIVKIVDYLLEFANFSDEFDRNLHHKISPQTIADFSVLLLRTTQKDKAWSLIDLLANANESSNVVDMKGSPPNQKCLLEAFDYATKEENLKNAATCLQLISRYNPTYSLKPFVDRLTNQFQFVDAQKQVLSEFSQS